ncbi:MAG: macro domain-containing protein [Erysipelotrichaceae bacterium]
MPFDIVDKNIVEMEVDAIVNSANHYVAVGRGVDSQIYQKAGSQLFKAREKIGIIDYGQAVITDGYQLPAKKIIHTVAPIYNGKSECIELLYSCYATSLKLAFDNNCSSVALPLLASGNNGFPKDIALKVANEAIQTFLKEHEDIFIYLLIYSKQDIVEGLGIENDLNAIIDRHLAKRVNQTAAPYPSFSFCTKDLPNINNDNCFENNRLNNLVETADSFSESLLKIIDSKNLKDSEVYNKANVSRQTFSKIRCNKNYNPDKNTALALAIALQLDLDSTQQLISKAGYVLSDSIKADIIVKYFINNKKYDILEINEALYIYRCKTLGSKTS